MAGAPDAGAGHACPRLELLMKSSVCQISNTVIEKPATVKQILK
jgi:hypothetical protein